VKIEIGESDVAALKRIAAFLRQPGFWEILPWWGKFDVQILEAIIVEAKERK
jgi:hypothetical protein